MIPPPEPNERPLKTDGSARNRSLATTAVAEFVKLPEAHTVDEKEKGYGKAVLL